MHPAANEMAATMHFRVPFIETSRGLVEERKATPMDHIAQPWEFRNRRPPAESQ
jgi:hypothetical protein